MKYNEWRVEIGQCLFRNKFCCASFRKSCCHFFFLFLRVWWLTSKLYETCILMTCKVLSFDPIRKCRPGIEMMLSDLFLVGRSSSAG